MLQQAHGNKPDSSKKLKNACYLGVRLTPEIDEVQAVPESFEYINKFHLCDHRLDWQFIDEMPYIDYQLFVIMLNAYSNKVKANQNNQGGGGSSFSDKGAIELEGDLDIG